MNWGSGNSRGKRGLPRHRTAYTHPISIRCGMRCLILALMLVVYLENLEKSCVENMLYIPGVALVIVCFYAVIK